MSGPYIIQVGERPSPFQPAERLQAWVGDGHVVQHPALAVAFEDRFEANRVASRFDLSAVQDAGDLYLQTLGTLALMACSTQAEFMAHMNAPSAQQRQDQQRWMRAVCSLDDRCPRGRTQTRAPIWALCDEDHAQEAGHGKPATPSL